MKNHQAQIIGVLQLINSTDKHTGEVLDFSHQDLKLAESLASQAAVALTNKKLIDEQKVLFETLIKLIATAINENHLNIRRRDSMKTLRFAGCVSSSRRQVLR